MRGELKGELKAPRLLLALYIANKNSYIVDGK
jgi:hypothetical protein